MNAITTMFESGNKLSKVLEKIDKVNKGSCSNGCLMRATPLSVFCYKLSNDKIYEYTKKDVNLTHTDVIALNCVVCYNIAIAHLLNNFGDAEGAIQRVDDYVQTLPYKKFIEIWEDIVLAKNESDLIVADKNIGYVVIAFSYAFFYLKKNYSYEKAINDMLLNGGDTDTNAAIVGGLLGARDGINKLRKDWVEKVINCQNDRPDFLRPIDEKNIYNLIDTLVAIAPEETKKSDSEVVENVVSEDGAKPAPKKSYKSNM